MNTDKQNRQTSGYMRFFSVLGFVLAALIILPSPGEADPKADYEAGNKAYHRDDWVSAIDYLTSSAKADYLPAMVMLAYIMDKAEENETALSWYKKAADAGSPAGALGLGQMLASGEGGVKNEKDAFTWISKAADANHPPAMTAMGHMFANGEMGMEIDNEKALAWFQKAADKKHTPAMFEIYHAYREGGLGLKKDPKKAAEVNSAIQDIVRFKKEP